MNRLRWQVPLIALLASITLLGCSESARTTEEAADGDTVPQTGLTGADTLIDSSGQGTKLPPPDTTHSAEKRSKAIGWPDGKTPTAPAGFTVTKFAGDLKHPRRIYVAPNSDIFVVESDDKEKSANRITMFRDTNNDGQPDQREVFMTGLSQPYGMLILNNYFYVANTDGLMRYPYKEGQTKITAKGEKIVELPAGGYNHHWTRNLIASPDGAKIYISVGSASNVGEYGMEEEERRAAILEINPDGSGERIYASGLRNPVGMDWAPGTNTLWTAVNERDNLGDELVPDYLTGVQEGGFYGWPYAYFGQNTDPRRRGERPDLVEKTLVPDLPLGTHTSSLGLEFYNGSRYPEKYRNGAFVGQHGSWNRADFVGYKVIFVPFRNGRPGGGYEDFLTGFIADESKNEVYGRPVGVAELPDGSLLVADDDGNTVWRVAAQQ